MIHCQISHYTHNNSHNDIHQDQECKIFFCLLILLLSHFFHNDCAASGGKHGGYCRHQLDNGSCQIDCGKRIGTDQIWHKQSVNHCVKRHKYCHCNRWHRKLLVPSMCRHWVRPFVKHFSKKSWFYLFVVWLRFGNSFTALRHRSAGIRPQ